MRGRSGGRRSYQNPDSTVHGSPLLRALIAFVALLLLGIPLWKLTRQAEAQILVEPVKVVNEEVETKDIHLQLSFTQVPTSFRVLFLGKEIWNETKPATEISHDLSLRYPKEGIDLEFQIDWPGDAPSAMRVQFQNPSGQDVDKTVWGKGQTDEVVTFE